MPNPTGSTLLDNSTQHDLMIELCAALGPNVMCSPYGRVLTPSEEEEAYRLDSRLTTTFDAFDDAVRRHSLEYEFSTETIEVCDGAHGYLTTTVERAAKHPLLMREAKALLNARQAGKAFMDKF